MDLVNRLKFFMESSDIAISQFADTCRIPRPTMSQILNGRNKKISDELISKIHTAYPELSVLWLMFGEGEMRTKTNTQLSETSNAENTASPEAYGTGFKPYNDDTAANSPIQENMAEKFGATTFEPAPQNQAPQSPATPPNATKPAGIDQPNTYSHTQAVIDFGSTMPISATHTNNEAPSPTYPNAEPHPHHYPQPTPAENSQPISTEPQVTRNTQEPLYTNQDTPPQAPSADSPQQNQTKKACSISLQTSPDKRITNIVVFYSDNSFQSFYPTTF